MDQIVLGLIFTVFPLDFPPEPAGIVELPSDVQKIPIGADGMSFPHITQAPVTH
jgi:hypothetical protein